MDNIFIYLYISLLHKIKYGNTIENYRNQNTGQNCECECELHETIIYYK